MKYSIRMIWWHFRKPHLNLRKSPFWLRLVASVAGADKAASYVPEVLGATIRTDPRSWVRELHQRQLLQLESIQKQYSSPFSSFSLNCTYALWVWIDSFWYGAAADKYRKCREISKNARCKRMVLRMTRLQVEKEYKRFNSIGWKMHQMNMSCSQMEKAWNLWRYIINDGRTLFWIVECL